MRRVKEVEVIDGLRETELAIIVPEVFTLAKRKEHQLTKRMIGRYIVADPAICHGQPTFRGTRILVADVMEQVAAGVAWEAIVEEWRGDVSPDAISEAVRLANQAFRDHSAQYTAQEYVLERAHP
ncbi:MAG TPA: DUF433 domain-containing protein [Candidatus Acidoferrales bacterium]|nr:DUF433 domain-containing protein [Candidatus Acidoferrales bacterium]